ncbi:MAG: ATP phosphoribosyltransferase regulatory subunit [Senegalimassilia faecalis]
MSSFDYYTGIVFEAYAPGLGAPLGSGGRYDNTIGAYSEGRPAGELRVLPGTRHGRRGR